MLQNVSTENLEDATKEMTLLLPPRNIKQSFISKMLKRSQKTLSSRRGVKNGIGKNVKLEKFSIKKCFGLEVRILIH